MIMKDKMKARVKETGKIVEVREEYDLRGEAVQVFYSNEEDPHEVYEKEELDFNVNDNINPTIDYWTRLEHTYAGMAMQGILSNPESELDYKGDEALPQALAGCAAKVAHALVEKYKEKEK
jgi:hypothetical protein